MSIHFEDDDLPICDNDYQYSEVIREQMLLDEKTDDNLIEDADDDFILDSKKVLECFFIVKDIYSNH